MHSLSDAQWKRISQDYAQMYSVLARISRFMSIKSLRSNAEQHYGLEPNEAIELAYENVISEAKLGLRRVRKPFVPVADAPEGGK